jgi:hypothetical protein
MNANKLVAWMCKDDDVITDKFKQSGKGGDCSEYNIPLYTHPAKTLTDEEILEIVIRKFGQSCYDNYFDSQWIEFARAILKKASEK